MTPSTQRSQDLPHGGEDALAEIAPVTESLTRRQRLVLETITAAIAAHGYPPSMREIGDTVGLTSSSSVSHQLKAIERKGFLRRDPKRPRAMEEVMHGEDDAPEHPAETDVAMLDSVAVNDPHDDLIVCHC